MGERSGFFLQAGLGLCYEFLLEDYENGSATGRETNWGGGRGAALAIGGAPAAGFVIAGLVQSFSAEVTHRVEHRDAGNTDISEEDRTLAAVAVSLMLQKYFGAFFLRGTLGGLSAAFEESSRDPYAGFAYGIGLGADFPISPKWALGFEFALTRAGGEFDEDGDPREWSTLNGQALFQVTYF